MTKEEMANKIFDIIYITENRKLKDDVYKAMLNLPDVVLVDMVKRYEEIVKE